MTGLAGNHYQTSWRYKETNTHYQNNFNIILRVIQEVYTPRIISTESYEITMIPRHQPSKYEYLSQPHENGFIQSGMENWTRGHVQIGTNLAQNAFGGAVGNLFEYQD